MLFFVQKKEYSAQISFLPPANDTENLSSLLNVSLPSMSSAELSADQLESIFASKAIKRRIIDHFRLYKNYKLLKSKNKFELAVQRLNKNVFFQVQEKGAIGISKILSCKIIAYHTSPDSAQMMADFTFGLLDSAVRSISIDRARRNRMFIEDQLNLNKLKLDSLQSVLYNFQIENKAYDISEQIKLSLKNYAEIKSAALFNELKLKALQKGFSQSTPAIMDLKKTESVYKNKLNELETTTVKDVIPSLSFSSKLLPKYTNLIRDIEVQNALILLISKELEQAKMQESRDISSLIIIDPSYIPEYKARPKRLHVMVTITGIYMFFILCFLILIELYKLRFKSSNLYRGVLSTLSESKK